MDEAFIGTIMMFAGNFAPKNWAFCNGQLLPISQNSALFSILGTTYGGDGMQTFGLPNLQSRMPIHAGQGPGLTMRRLGEVGGNESVTLTVNNLPAHNHTINCKSDGGSTNSPANAYPAGDNDPAATPFSAEKLDATMNQGALSTVGGSQPVSVESPYQVVNFIICLYGIYPSRP
jgi:microcystin-dependent protein